MLWTHEHSENKACIAFILTMLMKILFSNNCICLVYSCDDGGDDDGDVGGDDDGDGNVRIIAQLCATNNCICFFFSCDDDDDNELFTSLFILVRW